MTKSNFLKRWHDEFSLRQCYSTASREPFFALAGRYLPEHSDAVVADIGAADGSFARFLNLKERYPNLVLLDQNPESIEKLRKPFSRVEKYHAPERLPFKDASVGFIHLSHIAEHLSYQELYEFLKECDRVLAPKGVLAISTPLLWERFYDDLSHVKPYNPEVFLHYLTRTKSDASAEAISGSYGVCDLTYRYRVLPGGEWGSKYFLIEALVRLWRILVSFLGFRKYIRNGYTLILRKGI